MAGGTGFVGAGVVRALDDAGHAIAVLSRDPASVRRRFPNRAIEGRRGDVTRPGTLEPALAGVGTVVLCVQFAGSPVEAPRRGRTFLDVDAAGTRAVAAAARRAGVERLVYVSGVGANLASDRPWYRAKGIAEAAVAESGLAYAIVRPSWIYGPEDASLNRLVWLIRRFPWVFPQLGPGTQRLNPVFIADVSRLLARAARGELDGATLEIGGPQILSMDEVIGVAMRVVGKTKPILHVAVPLVKLAAAPLEFLPGQLLSRAAVDFITQSAVADNHELLRRFPEFELRPLADALTRYAAL
ncbi:MAG: NAD(P)H-binding protein [Gemmatimonadota bacterium]